MQWNDDAQQALGRAPAFLRGMICRKVEEHVQSAGKDVVTLADVQEARKLALSKRGRSNKHVDASDSQLTAEQIEKIVQSAKTQVVSDSRFYEVKVCGGASGCPRAIFDVRQLAERMISGIEACGVPDAVEKRVDGPVLRHHKFIVSMSGCANSCSQPQIVDFGVQGRARPQLKQGVCSGCSECITACKEDAITLDGAEIAFDRSRCIDCGDCASVCPASAIDISERGFSVLLGGKLGRHPQLARTLFEFADEGTLMAALRTSCELFMDDMRPGERFADVIDRTDPEQIRLASLHIDRESIDG